MVPLCVVVAAILWITPTCSIENNLLSGGETYNSEGTFSGVVALVIAASAAICFIIVIIACASLCPHQSSTYQDYGNDDAFFGDIRIGAPPVVEFGMYPPVESSPGTATANRGGRIVFEPLPDVAAIRRRLTMGSAGEEKDVIGRKLRPRVGRMERERTESGDSLDEVEIDGSTEKLKLDHVLANSRHQFPRSHLQYIKELGSSWFGKVLQGEGQGILPGHKKTKVVIQILSEEAEQSSQLVFLQEGLPYREIDHANVIRLLGQCVETIPYLSIYEYCSLGDLKTYLKSHRGSVETLDRQGLILNFTCDIAAGLQALHQQYFIHRDLALRNCLLTADMIVKVGDYGLAEEMFKDDYFYTERSDIGIPVRWLAPEVIQVEASTNSNRSNSGITLRTVTKDSNIWSFGVTLWELVTFGAQPYTDLSNEHVLRLVVLERSVRLSRPAAPVSHLDRLYELMQLCWQDQPSRRPSLRELRIMLLHLRSSRDQADTSAFDTKWNQLKPRQPVDTLPTVDIQHFDALGDATLSDRGSSTQSTIATVHRARAGYELRSDFGAARPTSFESEISSLNASLLAQAGSRQMSLKSASETPDSPMTFCGSSVSGTGYDPTSPVNELSLAAELGASQRLRGDTSIGDDDSVGNWLERGGMDDGDLGLGGRSAGNGILFDGGGVRAVSTAAAANVAAATAGAVAAVDVKGPTAAVGTVPTAANGVNSTAAVIGIVPKPVEDSAAVGKESESVGTVPTAAAGNVSTTVGIVPTAVSSNVAASASSVPAEYKQTVAVGSEIVTAVSAAPSSSDIASTAADMTAALASAAAVSNIAAAAADRAVADYLSESKISATATSSVPAGLDIAAAAAADSKTAEACAVSTAAVAKVKTTAESSTSETPVMVTSASTDGNTVSPISLTAIQQSDTVTAENGPDTNHIPHTCDNATPENYFSDLAKTSQQNEEDIQPKVNEGKSVEKNGEVNESEPEQKINESSLTASEEGDSGHIFALRNSGGTHFDSAAANDAKQPLQPTSDHLVNREQLGLSLDDVEVASNQDVGSLSRVSGESSFPSDAGGVWSADERLSSDSSSTVSHITPPISLDRSRANYSTYLQTVTTSLDSESSDFSDDISPGHGYGKIVPNSLPAVDEDRPFDGEKSEKNGDLPAVSEFDVKLDNEVASSDQGNDIGSSPLPLVDESVRNSTREGLTENPLLRLADEPVRNAMGEGLQSGSGLRLADEMKENSAENGLQGNPALLLADEIEKIAMGEEFLGDDTEFGRFYEESVRGGKESGSGNGDLDPFTSPNST